MIRLLTLALLLLPDLAAAAPRRVVSLNLCTDEYLLAVAAPVQIVSLTHLGHDPNENRWADQAKRFGTNNGTIDSVAVQQPDLILTMGGAPDDRIGLARALNARLMILPYPQTLDDVAANLVHVATVLGRPQAAQIWRERFKQMRASAPRRLHQASFVTSEGLTILPDGLSAQWMRLAGLRQVAMAGSRLTSEMLLTMKPIWLLNSRYRIGQMARSQRWPGLQFVRHRPGWRVIDTDGRGWLCGGPSLIDEIMRLRGQTKG
ncbi:ABC transporter substrate-binding protein [Aquisediminimonas sediminicola]|uniref:ABC transporter substrate-binding protein n=1 Tax=Alteraquisediminimonas sediminicola TaxID=2676787 RepID=UPI001C8E3730|nr:hypothetical protein [Aquisediminimonas sediminicola]